mmetsp:Transcript_12586/g.15840  ORF Transcript_12586/g.15840 Transcript_12586/m.15840 type:complete len:104 (-) Transcript_12586:315-626(-)|eukprot:CAMPEP_0172500322 /NCGR_PEP_ID=MMETSP1066-20121228/136943_1 /TAXON_ID=671091 /ORGANISM="Coscinodiscus wailesii, Strain CCMP2513" /LENGTH=103 /DNA_ID=CAMNT_0013274499 /DNA_START=137 /DNA_END=448 /DNA_ORIENTATION=+
MKLISFLTMIVGANAFVPCKLPTSRISSSTTPRFLVDPDIVHHLLQNCNEAASVIFINCDGGSCEMVEGIHDNDGSWHFDAKGPANPADGKSRVLMMAVDDDE